VNPAVAVFLGWAFVNEPIGARVIAAGAMILLAVVLIVGAKPRLRRPRPRLRPALAAIRAR
jgi:drug/metabolite transporter (DMT)-like permease